MYEPLVFMEQVQNLYDCNAFEDIRVPQFVRDKFSKMNETSLEFYDKYFSENNNGSEFIRDFSTNFLKLKYNLTFKELGLNKYAELREHYYDLLESNEEIKRLFYLADNDYDFFTFMIQNFIYYDWRFHKICYKLDGYIGKQLLTMDFPDNALVSCFTNVPVRTYYIDLNNVEHNLCKDLCGLYITTGKTGNEVRKVITCLIQGRKGRLLPLFLTNAIPFLTGDDNVPVIFKGLGETEIVKLQFEDGIYRDINIKGLFQFVANFEVYLHASNKDVEESASTKEAFSRPVSRDVKLKNKFREVRQYEVGYKLSTPVHNKIKNTGKSETSGTPKSAHYRSAHWHHFWTGSGEDKKLIVKWIEGVFVNGKAESDVAVVHKTK